MSAAPITFAAAHVGLQLPPVEKAAITTTATATVDRAIMVTAITARAMIIDG